MGSRSALLFVPRPTGEKAGRRRHESGSGQRREIRRSKISVQKPETWAPILSNLWRARPVLDESWYIPTFYR
jgi:hypothetical protein